MNDMTVSGRASQPQVQLSNRETEVLALLVKGCSNQQIADCLGIKFYTVSTHVKAIYKKMGVHKRTDAVVEALTGNILAKKLNSNSCFFPLHFPPQFA